MLLAHQRRQHPSPERNQFNNLSLHDIPFRTSTSTSHLLPPVPAESDIAKLSFSPSTTLESSPAISNLDYSETPDFYMPKGLSQGQPRSQPSSLRSASTQPPSNSVASSFDQSIGVQQAPWISSNNAAHLTSQPRFRLSEQHFHKRHSSESTVTSAGPNSPYTPVAAADSPHVVDADSQGLFPQHLDNYEPSTLSTVTSYSKPFPTSNGTFSDSLFFSPEFQNFSPQYDENHRLWEQAMTQVMSQQEQQQLQRQLLQRNGYRMSQSSQSLSGEPSGHANGGASNTVNNRLRTAAVDRSRMPNLDRTMSDIYQEQLYNPAEPTVPAPNARPSPPTMRAEGNMVSPRNSVITERLQAAGQGHIARSSSPTSAMSREKSPFRPDSKFAADGYRNPKSPKSRLGSASLYQPQQVEAEALAAQHSQPQEVVNEKTVSPKEVSLEYEPDEEASTAAPLMPDLHSPQHAHAHAHARTQQPSKLNRELTRPEYDAASELRRESSNMSNGSVRQNGMAQVPQQYPFIARQNSNAQRSQDSVPEFPAHMPSMESTKSEPQSTRSVSSSQSSSPESEVQRPAHTTADTGTYTCTYHGCTQRFESQSKLQRHKRDGHRQGTPNSTGADSRNTQAGPHKCERINPTTGKPCNSIFSRPYDLTRHEDTIHNAKKLKVKCQLCVEEKTFSRNDALTRHMRVVHPEVDFPGKISKRGRA